MAAATETHETEQLVSRMNAIRNVSEAHVADLHQQAQRLGDWREYVRAQPVLSVAVAACVGFVLIRNVRGVKTCTSHTPRGTDRDAKPDEVNMTAAKLGVSSGLMAFAGSLASAAARQYLMQKLRGLSEHD
jgi:hypothetical protein